MTNNAHRLTADLQKHTWNDVTRRRVTLQMRICWQFVARVTEWHHWKTPLKTTSIWADNATKSCKNIHRANSFVDNNSKSRQQKRLQAVSARAQTTHVRADQTHPINVGGSTAFGLSRFTWIPVRLQDIIQTQHRNWHNHASDMRHLILRKQLALCAFTQWRQRLGNFGGDGLTQRGRYPGDGSHPVGSRGEDPIGD